MRETSESTTTVVTAEPAREKRDLVGRLSLIFALAALVLALGEVCALLAVSFGYRPPASVVHPSQHIIPPLAVILGAVGVLFKVLDNWHQIARHRAFDPKEAANDVLIDDLAAALDRLRPGCLLRLALPSGLLVSLAVLLATFFWVVPNFHAFQIISHNGPHICQSDGTVAPFVLQLDNSINTVSVSWSAQAVEQLLGQPWAKIQPSHGTVSQGQREDVKVSANSLVCYNPTASTAPTHIGADLVSAQAQAVTQYHVSVSTLGNTLPVSVVALSVVVGLLSPTPTPGGGTAVPCTAPHPPLQAKIDSPSNGAVYYIDQNLISFKGSYSGGCGDSIPDSDMTWHANGYLLGHGPSLGVRLGLGEFTIKFSVTDPAGKQTANAPEVHLTVEQQGPTPTTATPTHTPTPTPTPPTPTTAPVPSPNLMVTQNQNYGVVCHQALPYSITLENIGNVPVGWTLAFENVTIGGSSVPGPWGSATPSMDQVAAGGGESVEITPRSQYLDCGATYTATFQLTFPDGGSQNDISITLTVGSGAT